MTANTDNEWICLTYLRVNLDGFLPLSQETRKETKTGQWLVVFLLSLLRVASSNRGIMRADLK